MIENSGLLVMMAVCYGALLFVIAWLGDRSMKLFSHGVKNTIYGLSLAVYCSSWSFLGTVGMASENLLSFVPIYLAPIILFIVCFPLLIRILTITRQLNITSLADFIASRYGKSPGLAILVTLIALMGIMPYFALQLKAIVNSLQLFDPAIHSHQLPIALGIAITLGIFTCLFGTRKLDATEQHPGLMCAIAFESLIKLVAFLAIGVVISFWVFDGLGDIWQQASAQGLVNDNLVNYQWTDLLIQTAVMMAAFLCMPRQFHTMMVEAPNRHALRHSRWIFPGYLLLAGLFVLPLALAGKLLLSPSVSPDSYMITLPLHLGYDALSILGFIGAVSAATGMVIVASLTLSIMISNELIVPLMLKTGSMARQSFDDFSRKMLFVRRGIIIVIMLMAWVVYMQLSSSNSLANLGQISLGVFIQILPALIGGIYWHHGNKKGVYCGLLIGGSVWCYTLISPVVHSADLFINLSWLNDIQPSYNDIALALALNCMGYIAGSLCFRAGVRERMQAGLFVNKLSAVPNHHRTAISEQELLMLASRFIGFDAAQASLMEYDPNFEPNARHTKNASQGLVAHTELILASVIGTSSASLVMGSVLAGRDMPLGDLVELIDHASSKIIASQNLLHSAIEHANEGMSVIDENYQLMAWNQRYAQLFDYPINFLKVGKPISEIIRFNAARGYCGTGEVEAQVQRRMERLKRGLSYSFERTRPDGKVIMMQGNPMPNGCFVTTFSDISSYRQVERQLVKAKQELELRVEERTQALVAVNCDLRLAKDKVEQVNLSKTRFMAAIGHDLMQPLNAARLFTASLLQQESCADEVRTTALHIADSLNSSGQLLADLLDSSRLESGALEVRKSDFPVHLLLKNFNAEFNVMAQSHEVTYRFVRCNVAIHSDINLLRRIVQNFLTNAFRYGRGGKVLLGCRRSGNELKIQVWDQGIGIAPEKIQRIFDEFKRLEHSSVYDRNGLGLGLAIADRIAKVLNHTISVSSIEHQGTVFTVTVPIVTDYVPQLVQPLRNISQQNLAGTRVLCIDNEETILEGLSLLLKRWQCDVISATSLEHAYQLIDEVGLLPHIMLADYHLNQSKTGLDAMQAIREKYQRKIPGVLITADTRSELIEEVTAKDYKYMAKMVRPAALRAMISSVVSH